MLDIEVPFPYMCDRKEFEMLVWNMVVVFLLCLAGAQCARAMGSSSQISQTLAVKPREQFCRIGIPHMLAHHFGKDVSIIRGDGQICAFIQRVIGKAQPCALQALGSPRRASYPVPLHPQQTPAKCLDECKRSPSAPTTCQLMSWNQRQRFPCNHLHQNECQCHYSNLRHELQLIHQRQKVQPTLLRELNTATVRAMPLTFHSPRSSLHASGPQVAQEIPPMKNGLAVPRLSSPKSKAQ